MKIGKGRDETIDSLSDETIQFTSLKYGGASGNDVILVDMQY